MPVGRTLIAGSPYLGVYLRANDRFLLAAPSVATSTVREVERLLGVEGVRTTVGDSEIAGAMVAFNSHGVLVGDWADAAECARLERIAPVHRMASRLNAYGNNVLANDHGAVVHPEYSDDALGRIGRALGVPVQRGTVAGLGTVGMAAVVTSRGVVVHPRTAPGEFEHLGSTLGVPVHRSTANFGVPVVGACVVANARGFVTGRPTTPVEIIHLQEGLSVFD